MVNQKPKEHTSSQMQKAENQKSNCTAPGGTDQLVKMYNLLAAKEWIFPGIFGSLSIKISQNNLFGEQEDILWIVEADSIDQIQTESITGLQLMPLRRLLGLENVQQSDLEKEIQRSCIRKFNVYPSWISLLHALFPHRCVIQACPPALLVLASSIDRHERFQDVFGGSLSLLDFASPGFPVANLLAKGMDSLTKARDAIFLIGYGLLVAAKDVTMCHGQIVKLERLAQEYLQQNQIYPIKIPLANAAKKPIRRELANLRKSLSDQMGFPVILHQVKKISSDWLVNHIEPGNFSSIVPPLLSFARYATSSLVIRKDLNSKSTQGDFGPIPQFVVDPDFGVYALGINASDAENATKVFRFALSAYLQAKNLGGYLPFSTKPLLTLGWTNPDPIFEATSAVFNGEIALVTGGASGIGKACVESLLARGAAVASLDINPIVVNQFHNPSYLGLRCDLTDEEAVAEAFENLGRQFGGLDMLVVNAGIFPAGTRIESLDLSAWQKVMRINLDSNLIVLREAYHLLKASPNGGRVVVNASKNVLAPGAGAAAYSSSKAAVTQMARVAALEWGADRIRVNMIHPDAVFDTGIWTDEVIQTRAAHYGLSVQQYKTRNLLRVELNSRDIGELVAAMLGPLFEKITGAQIPVDGGSDRVI